MTDETRTASIGGITPVYQEDQGPGWAPLVRRLSSAARGRMSVLTVRVIVDEHGNPLHWTSPSVCHVEPRARGESFDALLRALAGGTE